MKSVTKRELNQQTAHVLAAVDGGGPIVVTERGVARWVIESVHEDALARLHAAGRVTQAKESPAPWGPVDLRKRPRDVDALLAEMRADG